MGRHPLHGARSRAKLIARGIALTVLATAALGACGDGTGPSQPAILGVLSGNNQVGTVGDPLPESIRVRVTDGSGRGVAGALVEFEVPAGDGWITSAASGETNGNLTVRNSVALPADSRGEVAVVWTLGELAGEQTAFARVEGRLSLELAADARPGPPSALVLVGGDNQVGLTGGALAQRLTVRLRDEYGNPVAGSALSWVVKSGGGSLSPTAQTDEAGEAEASLTLGDGVGFNAVTARHADLPAVEFTSLGLSALIHDAAEDTFSNGISGFVVHPDILTLGAGWRGAELVVGIEFKEVFLRNENGTPIYFDGLLDFDIDADPATGVRSAVDINRPGDGTTGMGVELWVDLGGTSTGNFIIFDPIYRVIGFVTPSYHGNIVSFAVPAAVLGNGPLKIALVVATHREPTDIAPDNGSVLIGPRP